MAVIFDSNEANEISKLYVQKSKFTSLPKIKCEPKKVGKHTQEKVHYHKYENFIN